MPNVKNHSIDLNQILNIYQTKFAHHDPFTPTIIVVPHTVTGRWLAQQLALHTGIAAHLHFLTPDKFFWQMLRHWQPHLPERSLWQRETLTWHIMQQLPKLLTEPAFSQINRYLAQETTDLRLLRLAQRIAAVFERYLLFRIDWLLAWEQGHAEHWQAQLWRTLIATGIVKDHLGKILHTWQTNGLPTPIKSLPRQVFFYKINKLIPIYKEFLNILNSHITIHILDATIQSSSTTTIVSHTTKLLPCIQNYIANLTHPHHQIPQQQFKFAANDFSLQIHSCHSQLREVQVLHDNLLRMFELWRDLKPHEILIAATNLDEYAQFIEAVFGATDLNRIPYALAYRNAGNNTKSLYTAIELILKLPHSRFSVSEILTLLQLPAIQRCFNLDSNGWERIQTWVQESGICWGLNATQRTTLQLPSETANTWEFGLNRLFLGIAMSPNTYATPYCGVLPYTNIEGSEVAYLEILQTFLHKLTYWQQQLLPPRSLINWQITLQTLCKDLFALDELEQDALLAWNAEFTSLIHHATIVNFTQNLSLASFSSLFKELWEKTTANHPRLFTGRVTFCSLDTIARIPFRIICLLGMNSRAFPRQQRLPYFDLMLHQPRSGDPSQRQDDHDLFWDTLLLAKDCLYISYIGHDIQDNSLKTPSPVVSTLLDYINKIQDIAKTSTDTNPTHLPIEHPLQPFSPRAFDTTKPHLNSYAKTWLAAALTPIATEPPCFAAAPLSAPDASLRTLDITDLIQFFDNSAKYFLTRRLGIKFSKEQTTQDDFEPFTLNALQTYHLCNNMLPLVQADWDQATLLQRARAEGVLPHGASGALLFKNVLQPTYSIVARLAQHAAQSLESLEINLYINEFNLRGVLNNLTSNGILEQRVGRLRSKDRLKLWIKHLVLCTMQPPGIKLNSCFVAKDAELQLEPVTEPLPLLNDLLDLRWQGLMAPLAFFPESSLACYEYGLNSKELCKQWEGVSNYPSNYPTESEDRAVRIAFRGANPIDATFVSIAERVFAAIAVHGKVIELKH